MKKIAIGDKVIVKVPRYKKINDRIYAFPDNSIGKVMELMTDYEYYHHAVRVDVPSPYGILTTIVGEDEIELFESWSKIVFGGYI